MRTFQFSDAKSHKFWNIDVQGDQFTVTYGKVGTAGQSQTKSFATAEKAQAEADKLIREKTAKGYRETTPKAAASPGEALERAVIADPHDTTAWSALADYLTERGDPRGEFMQVQRALEDGKLTAAQRKKLQAREQELLAAHEKEWVGDWADLVNPAGFDPRSHVDHTGGRKYEFRRGLLTTVNFGALTVDAARAFVKAPQTRFVRELFVGGHPYEDEFEPGPDIPEGVDVYGGAAEHVLLRWPHLPNVRRLQFGWMEGEDYTDWCGFNCHLECEHVADFVKQMPDVEEVLVFAHVGNAKLFGLTMPGLRVLQLYHGSNYALKGLAENPSLTKLTHLLCHPHAPYEEEAHIRLPQLRAVCRSKYLTSLTHLRLRLSDFGDAGAREVVSSGILKRLKVLDLRHGNVTDEGAKVLADCPDLRNLESLDLSRNALTDEGMNALRATKVPVALGYQHQPADPDDDYVEYLYQGDIE
jgi:uncharacterized protein (TIGR02996 family)